MSEETSRNRNFGGDGEENGNYEWHYYSRPIQLEQNQHTELRNKEVEKKILAVFAFAPGILAFCQGALFMYDLCFVPYRDPMEDVLIEVWAWIFLIRLLVGAVSAIVFIVHASDNKWLSREWKWKWGILLFVFNVIASPVYWVKYIRE